MFITVKRHEREKQEALTAASRLTDTLLQNSDQGLFLLDARDRVLSQVSRSLATLFRRQDFGNLTFEKLLSPHVTAKTLRVVRKHIAALLSGTPVEEGLAANPFDDIDLRLANADGSFDAAHYRFDFSQVETQQAPKLWLVRVTDITLTARAMRELEDLRTHSQIQGEILRGVLQMGGARFGTFLQRSDAAMKTINMILKKPTREEDTFRHKLEATLDEVDRIRREAAAFKFVALETTARLFEDALHGLRNRTTLSGSDFLPLAVKLDQLYGQFALIKSLTVAARALPAQTSDAPSEEPAAELPLASSQGPAVTENGTLILENPMFIDSSSTAQTVISPALGVHRATPGSLEGTLLAMTEHVAQEQKKSIVLESQGLEWVPTRYQAAVKNLAVQLIRNAIMHGIEAPEAREAAGKTPHGTLRLEFRHQDDRFELMFEDDGCGLDPDRVRAVAIERGVVTAEAAARMRDREAIKLIFRSGFTTLATSSSDRAHGSGMSLVRRYVNDAGGKIALASLAGHETRFKITLPATSEDAAATSVDSKVA